jgi:hypothetical protein
MLDAQYKAELTTKAYQYFLEKEEVRKRKEELELQNIGMSQYLSLFILVGCKLH